MKPAIAIKGPRKGRVIGTEYEPADDPQHLLVWVSASDAATANADSAGVQIRHDGRPLGESFGAVNVVPADRPGLEVGGEILRPGPASGHWARILTSADERARITGALKDVPHETATPPIREHVDTVFAEHGLADQTLRRAALPLLPVEAIEALIAVQDEKAISEGVLEWIKSAEHPEAARIEAAADAKTAEMERAAVFEGGR